MDIYSNLTGTVTIDLHKQFDYDEVDKLVEEIKKRVAEVKRKNEPKYFLGGPTTVDTWAISRKYDTIEFVIPLMYAKSGIARFDVNSAVGTSLKNALA